MNKRPKSREETPKEGSDSARRYRTSYERKRPARWPGLIGCRDGILTRDLLVMSQTSYRCSTLRQIGLRGLDRTDDFLIPSQALYH